MQNLCIFEAIYLLYCSRRQMFFFYSGAKRSEKVAWGCSFKQGVYSVEVSKDRTRRQKFRTKKVANLKYHCLAPLRPVHSKRKCLRSPICFYSFACRKRLNSSQVSMVNVNAWCKRSLVFHSQLLPIFDLRKFSKI